ncbi:MAG: NAD-glutamate dehydrogenase [Rhodospirillaceae bacterium]|nr:NAD-glutamate dehydrogenase [Rhodospirillaceae bacterium]
MKMKAETLKDELLESIAKIIADRMPAAKAGPATAFTQQFYANVAPQDVLEEEPEDLFGAALSIWGFGRDRAPGVAKVRAYNPRFEENGWQSAHTVIEIVNDDMPFLVDSVTSALARRELTVHLVIHPIIHLSRDAKGGTKGLLDGPSKAKGAVAESFMHVQVSEQTSADALREIEKNIQDVLSDVRAGVEDWRTMRAKMLSVIKETEASPFAGDADDLPEICAFLRWIEDNNFTFLGVREYKYTGTGKSERMEVVEGSGLGVLRDPDVSVFDGLRELGTLPKHIHKFLTSPERILIMKANRKSTVHRAVHLDSISVKRLDKKGKVLGEHRFIGLFTSAAYNQSPREIPMLGRKVQRIIERTGFGPASHNGKALINILERYPRDELLQASVEELYTSAIGILRLQERQKTALFLRRDAFDRFVSTIVYIPRERYTTALRQRISSILSTAFNGSMAAFYTQISDDPLAQVHYIIKTTRGEVPDVDREELETRLIEASRSWSDKLQQALIENKGEEQGNKLFQRYGDGFPTSYRESNGVQAAVFDMERMEEALAQGRLEMNLSRPIGAEDDVLELRFFHLGTPIPLSDILPMLENMGVRVISESPFEVSLRDKEDPIWIHDFEMRLEGAVDLDLGRIKAQFHESFSAVWDGRMEDDGFNVLVLQAGMSWREVSILRAYAKYLRQAAFTFSQTYMEQALTNNSAIAGQIVELFKARFDTALEKGRASKCQNLVEAIEALLEDVVNLDEDRILRRFLNLVQSTLRTNYYQPNEAGDPKAYVSFKLDSQAIEELPLPRPMVEIWVYSPRVEAVHLRGGKVARGGIRWSDRREDFRTEILGLMKAQQVKNAVIVPVGSKGGFVVKQPPSGGRDEFLAEGIECYKLLMRGMLDITDNIDRGVVIPPTDVIRHDDDDPYLVVAADKGTATFSDIANGVSQDYGFWLDDAFASGGSAGYDHKKMGITARGGWESVKRHFRELGTNIQTTDFTVVGVGDMSGDVFGNGMLLSKHIRLLGAFNHLHIFVDPNPDAAKSWTERSRMFDLPRSSWSDYNPKLISKGGGIFDRSAKSLKLSREIRDVFGIEAETVTPNELIRAIIVAKADLLWFGGIGTYVKAGWEANVEAGDRANDAVRVDGEELRCKVVGEGANLGVTQRGRIEIGRRGISINSDAIDNSAGVDCSDHEVNIKILVGSVVRNGDMTTKQRDELLVKMTDEVGELVLKDNYDQTQALTMALSRGADDLDEHSRLMRQLERGATKLNREIEFLPDEEEIEERSEASEGLARPELAVLLAYAKMEMYDELLLSDLPDDPSMRDDLERYFPERLRKQYAKEIHQHPLAREIIATYVTNSMINRVGASFIATVREHTGDIAPNIARAYIAARDIFNVRGMWGQCEDLDDKIPAEVQTRMLLEIKSLVERAGVWLLRNERRPLDIRAATTAYRAGVAELRACLPSVLSDFDRKTIDAKAEEFCAAGVPKDLAWQVAANDVMVSACDVVRLATQTGEPVARVAEVYFSVGSRFALDWLRDRAEALVAETHWQKMAVSAVVDDFFNHQIQLAQDVLAADASANGKGGGKGKKNSSGKGANANTGSSSVEAWEANRGETVDRAARLISDLRGSDGVDLAMLAVANGQMRSLLAR